MNYKKKKHSPRHRLLVLIWLLQLVAEGMALAGIWKLNMLPADYLMMLAGVFGVMLVLTGWLMLPRWAEGFRSGAGVFLSFTIFAVACAASLLVQDAHGAIADISGHTGGELTLAVYVRKDDAAQSIRDAAAYRFAAVRDYEVENTQKVVDAVEKELGQEIELRQYDGTQSLLAAFFSGESDALILNSAYTSLLEELEGYEDFYDRIRVLYEVKSNAWSSMLESIGQNGLFQNQDEKRNVTKDPFVLYLSGSDTRNKTLSTTGRSDVNILAVVNPETKQVLLINTPRDYYISNPASSSGTKDKLTHCGNYGIECSVQALMDLYDVDVDYYAQINFSGLETMIDAIGGVTVTTDLAFSTIDGYHFPKGEVTLDGKQALSFARERKNLPSGDNGRGKNQMKVITAVINKLTSGSTLLANYSEIMESLTGMFVTSMPASDISSLVKMQLGDLARWNIHSFSVTGTNGSAVTYSAPGMKLAVIYPDDAVVAYAAGLIDRMMEDEILADADLIYNP